MINPYIPYTSETAELEAEYMRNLTLDRICNSFGRISEMLTNLHADLNAPKESEVQYAN